MTIRHLRIFIEVAKSGKMSLAANKFFISQPTVSQTISELEKHYSLLLFERISKRLYITNAGRTLLNYATKVVTDFDELEYCMLNNFHSQPIRVGTSVTIGTCLASEIATKFKQIQPEVDLNITISNTKEIEQKLLNIDLDLALVEGQVKSFDLISTPVMEDPLVLVCSKDHKFAKQKNISIEELKSERFILREEGSGTRELFLNYMKIKQIPIKIAWESNNSEAIKIAVMDNQGLSVISKRLISKEIENNLICIVPIEGCKWSRQFSLVYHKNKYISAQLSSLIDLIHSYSHYDPVKLPHIKPTNKYK